MAAVEDCPESGKMAQKYLVPFRLLPPRKQHFPHWPYRRERSAPGAVFCSAVRVFAIDSAGGNRVLDADGIPFEINDTPSKPRRLAPARSGPIVCLTESASAAGMLDLDCKF